MSGVNDILADVGDAADLPEPVGFAEWIAAKREASKAIHPSNDKPEMTEYNLDELLGGF